MGWRRVGGKVETTRVGGVGEGGGIKWRQLYLNNNKKIKSFLKIIKIKKTRFRYIVCKKKFVLTTKLQGN